MDFRRVLFRSGGTWSVTPTRLPYVGSLAPGLYSASGFSGLCVVLAPYFGRILGDAIAGDGRALDRLSRLPVLAFPGGRWLRWPILAAGMTMFARSEARRGGKELVCPCSSRWSPFHYNKTSSLFFFYFFFLTFLSFLFISFFFYF